MPMPPLSDKELLRCVNAVAKHGTVPAAAKAIKMRNSTLSSRVAKAKARGIVATIKPKRAAGLTQWHKDVVQAVEQFQNKAKAADHLGITKSKMRVALDQAKSFGLEPNYHHDKKIKADQQAALDAYTITGSFADAARQLNVEEQTFRDRVKAARRRGLVPNGAESVDVKPLDPTDARILQLERELILVRDQKTAAEAKIRTMHRENGVYQTLADEMERMVKPLTPLPSKVMKHKKHKHAEPLVLHLSDEHADQVVQPHRVGGLEEYNIKVALARAEKLVDRTIAISQDTLSNYQFTELWILAYGDHVNGEIHDATNHSQYRNAFDNTLAVGQMHALMIRDLAPYFPSIKVLYLAGNHGRRTPKKDYHGAKDNWDYLVGRTAEMLCTDIGNVEFLIPDSFSYTFQIGQYNFCAFHGDDIKSWNGIPHYGIERKTRRLTSLHAAQGREIHYYVMGHFHSMSSITHPSGEVIINGSWKATDEYSYESLGVISKPSQLLHGVGDHGISFRFPIYLKHDGDTDGPARYTGPLRTLGHLEQLDKV